MLIQCWYSEFFIISYVEMTKKKWIIPFFSVGTQTGERNKVHRRYQDDAIGEVIIKGWHLSCDDYESCDDEAASQTHPSQTRYQRPLPAAAAAAEGKTSLELCCVRPSQSHTHTHTQLGASVTQQLLLNPCSAEIPIQLFFFFFFYSATYMHQKD